MALLYTGAIGVDVERTGGSLDHFARDDDFLDALQAREVEHGLEQDALQDGTQTSRPVLRSIALRATAPRASSAKVRSMFSISNSRWYCLTNAFLGSARIFFSEVSSRSSSLACTWVVQGTAVAEPHKPWLRKGEKEGGSASAVSGKTKGRLTFLGRWRTISPGWREAARVAHEELDQPTSSRSPTPETDRWCSSR